MERLSEVIDSYANQSSARIDSQTHERLASQKILPGKEEEIDSKVVEDDDALLDARSYDKFIKQSNPIDCNLSCNESQESESEEFSGKDKF